VKNYDYFFLQAKEKKEYNVLAKCTAFNIKADCTCIPNMVKHSGYNMYVKVFRYKPGMAVGVPGG
jgi:hypothetical protein